MYIVEITNNLTDFGELLKHVLSGEEVIISQVGNPIARIVPIPNGNQPRIPGCDRGQVMISADFNSPLPEDVLNDFLNL